MRASLGSPYRGVRRRRWTVADGPLVGRPVGPYDRRRGSLRVVGGARLVGAVRVPGAKNSALKLMAAALLADGSHDAGGRARHPRRADHGRAAAPAGLRGRARPGRRRRGGRRPGDARAPGGLRPGPGDAGLDQRARAAAGPLRVGRRGAARRGRDRLARAGPAPVGPGARSARRSGSTTASWSPRRRRAACTAPRSGWSSPASARRRTCSRPRCRPGGRRSSTTPPASRRSSTCAGCCAGWAHRSTASAPSTLVVDGVGAMAPGRAPGRPGPDRGRHLGVRRDDDRRRGDGAQRRGRPPGDGARQARVAGAEDRRAR